MRRQFSQLIDRLDLFARNVGEWIELQPLAILFDDGDLGTRATLKALASVDPGGERFECPRQRLHLANAASTR